MTFETEMDQFFARNCYFEKERERVKAWPAYRLAVDTEDIIQAQEIATRVLEGGLGIVAKKHAAWRHRLCRQCRNAGERK